MAALITATSYQAFTGQTFSGADETALSGWCAAVDNLVRKYLRPYSPDPLTLTSHIMDAPTGNVLVIPATPVRTLTSIYWHAGANGEVAEFTADDLLTVNDDYWMPTDPFDGYSRTGFVYRRGLSAWLGELRYPNRRALAAQDDPARGAVMVNATCGETSVPDAITAACVLMVSLIFARRKTGLPLTSESWNGYSAGYASPFLVAVLYSPDVQAILAPFRPVIVHVAGD